MIRRIPLQVVRGFFMGTADIVPGVSGGTVALVFGIYHPLVTNIKTGADALGRLLRLDLRGGLERLRAVDWLFLLPLLGGIGLAVVSLAHALEVLLEERPIEMAAVFLGLVAGSVAVAWRLLGRRDPARLAALAGVAVVVFVALGLRTGTTEDAVAQVADPALWAFFAAGALAICAMILPGVSGSFLLVMVGMYGAVLGAVNARDLPALALFGIGCVVGLALFSQLLHWALNTHYDTVMAVLIGLMLGSLRVLWPWPAGTETTRIAAPHDPWVLPVVLALVGFAVVFGVSRLALATEHRSDRDVADEIQAT